MKPLLEVGWRSAIDPPTTALGKQSGEKRKLQDTGTIPAASLWSLAPASQLTKPNRQFPENVAEGHYEAAQTMVAPAAFKCTCGRRKAIRVHPKRRAGFWAKEIILDLTIAICRYSAG